MIFTKIFVILFSLCCGVRVQPKSDKDMWSSNARNNLTSKKQNPIQRRYAALSALFERKAERAKVLEQSKQKTVFDDIEKV